MGGLESSPQFVCCLSLQLYLLIPSPPHTLSSSHPLLLTPSPLHSPVYTEEAGEEEVVEEGEGGELSLSQLEDQLQEVEEGESEDDEGVFLDLSGLKLGETPEVRPVSFPEQLCMGMSLGYSGLAVTESRPPTALQDSKEGRVQGAMESTVDAQEWRLEVERVLPSLKVHVRQDHRVSGRGTGL